jgi:hypothetical protein
MTKNLVSLDLNLSDTYPDDWPPSARLGKRASQPILQRSSKQMMLAIDSTISSLAECRMAHLEKLKLSTPRFRASSLAEFFLVHQDSLKSFHLHGAKLISQAFVRPPGEGVEKTNAGEHLNRNDEETPLQQLLHTLQSSNLVSLDLESLYLDSKLFPITYPQFQKLMMYDEICYEDEESRTGYTKFVGIDVEEDHLRMDKWNCPGGVKNHLETLRHAMAR